MTMFFNKFTIKDFKCYAGTQDLVFAIPDAHKPGSGLTYIVGVNNSGKTTLIEGLSIRNKRNIKESEKIPGVDPEFSLFSDDKVVRQCKLIRPESSTIIEEPKLDNTNTFEIISSRRHWESNANNVVTKIGDSFASAYELINRQNSLQVGAELRAIEADNVKYPEFINLVQRVIPEFTKFAVGYEDNHYIQYISNNGVRHKSELLGDGVITVIRILLQLFVEKQNAIIIDEPELSLHPSAQRSLLKILAEYSQKRQIILSTHSPYLINWEYLENGAVLNRVVKENDLFSSIFSINDFKKHSTLIKSANWQMPFIMDEVAKEVFFMEDNILFLEGQEDVGLLQNEPALKDINIFGYDVRGASNFKFALTLAKDLGYKKVACILDFGAAEQIIKKDLEKTFPSYKIFQWNKSDIRDKPIQKTPALKEGYFDFDGKKKQPADLDDFDQKINEIKDSIS